MWTTERRKWILAFYSSVQAGCECFICICNYMHISQHWTYGAVCLMVRVSNWLHSASEHWWNINELAHSIVGSLPHQLYLTVSGLSAKVDNVSDPFQLVLHSREYWPFKPRRRLCFWQKNLNIYYWNKPGMQTRVNNNKKISRLQELGISVSPFRSKLSKLLLLPPRHL